jgi:uncharacterized lipoprotein YajG
MMKSLMLLALATVLLAGCASQQQQGSREYIPGKGWLKN